MRDLMLRRKCQDVDLVTEGDVDALAMGIAEAVGSKPVLHRRFGTATVKLGETRLDLAMARKEKYVSPGALPAVAAGTIEEDLLRRDFTINAMALGLTGRHEGRFLDPSGGMADLSRGEVRILHKKSFVDDPTRIFRAIRYEQRLGFHLDSNTLENLAEALTGGVLATVSADRLRRELELIMEEERPVRTLMRAGELDVLRSLFPPLGEVEWIQAFDEDVESLTLVAALAFRMNPEEGLGLVARLNMPPAWSEAVTGMGRLKSLMPDPEESEMTHSELYRMLEGCPISSIDALRYLSPNEIVRGRLDHFMTSLRYEKPILRGGELIELGVSQGPKVGKILRMIQDARLDGEVASREDERTLVRRLLKMGSV